MSKKTTNPRINFATSKILEYPDLLEVQLKSFKDFFQLETTPDSRRGEAVAGKACIRYSRKFSRLRIRGTTMNSPSSITLSIRRSIPSRSVLREDLPTTFL